MIEHLPGFPFLLGQVRAWRIIFAVALATLWVAAGSHCRLEVLPGFEFLSCCQHPEDEKSPAHHEKDAADDGCAAIELGFYKLDQAATCAAETVAGAGRLVGPFAGRIARPAPWTHAVSASSSPPELSRIWQFFQRTALPPRAPSFVS